MLQTLETRRLTLIPFSLEMKKVVTNDKAKLAKIIGVRVPEHWPGPDLTEALPFFLEEMEKNPAGSIWDGIIIHRADKVIIGDMGFIGGPDEAGVVEIGYSIIPEYRNLGYATEMAQALIRWAFQQQEIKVVIANCLYDNIGSIKVLEKVGMRPLQPEGYLLKWQLRKVDRTQAVSNETDTDWETIKATRSKRRTHL
jgi:ribosomal-protein-alanine N-acetyltransferase